MGQINTLRGPERARQAEEERRRNRLTVAVAVYGGVLGVLALYVTLTARIADTADYYTYELARPVLLHFLRNSAPGFLGGLILAGLLNHLVSRVVTTPGHPLKWMATAAIYGLFLPFATGLLIPMNGVFVDLAIGSTLERGLWLSFADAVIDTPVFTYVYGIMGVYIGLVSGVMLSAGVWLADLANTSGGTNSGARGPYLIAVAMSLALGAAIMFGPFALFRLLVESLGRVG